MNNKIVLSVKNLNKTYNKKIHALKNLNLEVKEGEIFGLLGPNGAGKSTFINILAGLTTKTSGDVNVWGFNMDKNPRQVRVSLGIVPQEINVDPFFTPKYSWPSFNFSVKNLFTTISLPVIGAKFTQKSLFFSQYNPTPIWK